MVSQRIWLGGKLFAVPSTTTHRGTLLFAVGRVRRVATSVAGAADDDGGAELAGVAAAPGGAVSRVSSHTHRPMPPSNSVTPTMPTAMRRFRPAPGSDTCLVTAPRATTRSRTPLAVSATGT